DNGAVAQRRAARLLEQAVALDSNFAEAWAEMSINWGLVYSNGTRDLDAGERARVAAARAVSLRPNTASSHLAQSRYLSLVAFDVPASIREIDKAIAAEPNNADAQAHAATSYMNIGDFDRARRFVERARELDPRSPVVLTNQLRILVQLEEFEAAKTVGHDALALSHGDIQAVQDLAISYFGTGDVDGARAMLREAMTTIPSTELVAYFIGYNETGWMLDEAAQQLAFRLSPSSFDGDVAWWGQSMATLAWERGERDRARDYAR